MPTLSYCPFSFTFSIHVVVLTTGSPSSVSRLPLLAFSPFFWDVLIWLFFVAFLCGGFTFSVPSRPSVLAFLPVPNVFTSSGVFSVCGLCFTISAYIFAFSDAILFASLSFIFFCICIPWPFLVLVFWPLFLLISFQFHWHFFCHIWAYHLLLFWLYQYLHHLVPFVFVF